MVSKYYTSAKHKPLKYVNRKIFDLIMNCGGGSNHFQL